MSPAQKRAAVALQERKCQRAVALRQPRKLPYARRLDARTWWQVHGVMFLQDARIRVPETMRRITIETKEARMMEVILLSA